MKKRLIGVTIIGALYTLFGLGGLFNIITHDSFENVRQLFSPPQSRSPEFTLPLLGGYVVLFACPSIIGIGLLTLRNWARWLVIITSGFMVLQSFGFAWYGHFGFNQCVSLAYGLVLFGLVIWYFLLPGVKAQFVKSADSN